MKKITSLLLLLFILQKNNAQSYSEGIDSTLQSIGKRNNRLKKIMVGNGSKNIAYHYIKETGKLFSIIDRHSYESSNKYSDSSLQTGYFFIDDKLVKTNYIRSARDKKVLRADMYFLNGQLVDKKIPPGVYIPGEQAEVKNAQLLFIQWQQSDKRPK